MNQDMNQLTREYQSDEFQLPQLARALNPCEQWRYEGLDQMVAAYLQLLKKSDLAEYTQDQTAI